MSAIAYLEYGSAVHPNITPKGHKERAKAAIRHLSGLGKLLQCVGLEASALPPAQLTAHLNNLTDGAVTVGELIDIIADAAYTSVEEIPTPEP